MEYRLIGHEIKMQVWKRDNGKCTICGSTEKLFFAPIISYEDGGSSADVENIHLICQKCRR